MAYRRKLAEFYSNNLNEKLFNLEHEVMNLLRVEYLMNRLKASIDFERRTVAAALAPCVGDSLEEEILGRLEVSIEAPLTLQPVRLEQWTIKSSRCVNGLHSLPIRII